MNETAILFLTLISVIGFYFLPTLVAKGRKHNNVLSIFVFNLFFGWCILGYLLAMVWSCSNNVSK